jgi:hypothetical protein
MPVWARPIGRDDCRQHPHRGRNGQQIFGDVVSDPGSCCTVWANHPAISADCGWVPDEPIGILRGRFAAGRVGPPARLPSWPAPGSSAQGQAEPAAGHLIRRAGHPRLHVLHEGILYAGLRRRNDVVAFAGHYLIRLLRLGPQVAEVD